MSQTNQWGLWGDRGGPPPENRAWKLVWYLFAWLRWGRLYGVAGSEECLKGGEDDEADVEDEAAELGDGQEQHLGDGLDDCAGRGEPDRRMGEKVSE